MPPASLPPASSLALPLAALDEPAEAPPVLAPLNATSAPGEAFSRSAAEQAANMVPQ